MCNDRAVFVYLHFNLTPWSRSNEFIKQQVTMKGSNSEAHCLSCRGTNIIEFNPTPVSRARASRPRHSLLSSYGFFSVLYTHAGLE